jgi:hypothetical protein
MKLGFPGFKSGARNPKSETNRAFYCVIATLLPARAVEGFRSSPQRHGGHRAFAFFDCREKAAIENGLPGGAPGWGIGAQQKRGILCGSVVSVRDSLDTL